MNSTNKSDSLTGKQSSALVLSFLALGVVFGDIGTSPLYALRETFFGYHPITTSEINVLGALSLFFWSLAIVVTLKYVFLIINADNEGEGGIFSLLGLIKQSKDIIPANVFTSITLLILLGAALLYGDGIITPAISVLSAVEGVEIVTPALKSSVIPLTLLILFVLFSVQKRGTQKIGTLFGPIMITWFIMLIVMALPQIAKHPEVLQSINPYYGVLFLWHQGFNSFWILGAVVLCVTGGEALYADLGHFGKKAIRQAWLYCVYPALLINYFGQGARLLEKTPIPHNNLFYSLVPEWGLIPAVILSTTATVIASQALISGCYSLTHQAIALGVFPRTKIQHTNPDIKGQIYLPVINWMLFTGCALLVVTVRSSSNLAAAYGLAVTGTMAVTTAAFFVVARYRWNWSLAFAGTICGSLVAIDLAFFIANSLKFFQGGFIPIVVAVILFSIMWTWRWGRALVAASYEAYENFRQMSWLIDLKKRLEESGGALHDTRPRWITESDRVVVFMTSRPVANLSDSVPTALRVHLKRTGVLPKYVILLTIIQEKVPYVASPNRYKIVDFGYNISSIQAKFGFMETPNAKEVIRELKEMEVISNGIHRCSIEIGEEDLYSRDETVAKERFLVNFFEMLLRFASPAHHYFGLRDVPGLAKIIIPISVSWHHTRIEIPEFAFDEKEEIQSIDPDTLKPSETQFTDIV